jgi:DNA-directed RNA polymerase specialized sigma24 family protein
MKNKNPVAIPPWQPNQKVLRDMYDSYAPALYGCILKLVPDKKLAGIVLVDSYVRIYGNLHLNKDPREELFPWMLRIVLHQCKFYCHIPNAVILSSLVTSSTTNRKK